VGPVETVDARAARFDHGVLALALLCGFVFEFVPVIPGGGLLMALSWVRPEMSVAPWLFTRVLAPRLPSSPRSEDAAPWRTAALLAAFLLGLGTLSLAIGDRGVAWVFALAVAALAALTSAGGICVGCELHARRRRGGRDGRPGGRGAL
jgi:Domain of unknown function (DUF4395)